MASSFKKHDETGVRWHGDLESIYRISLIATDLAVYRASKHTISQSTSGLF